MMNWHIVTSNEFALGAKVSDDLYFLSDTHEIYRGEIPYTEGVILYTEEPTAKAINKLYINSTTLEGKIWNGSAWIQIVKPIASVVTVNGTNPVNGTAVAAYVAAELAAYSISGDSISSLSWASATHLLNITKTDDTTSTIEFDGLAVDLSASASNGKTHIQLLDSKGNTIGSMVDLDLERFVTGAEYIVDTKTIILYFDAKTGDESTDKISIPVGDLVDTYTVTDTSSVDLTMASNNISATVKISTISGNTITLNEDGLYVASVDTSKFQTLVSSAIYDNEEKTIALAFNDSSTPLVIDIGDLVDTYTVSDTGTIDMTIASNVISGTVKVSTVTNNSVVAKSDGIFVDISGKVDKINSTAGNLVVVAADGKNVAGSSYIVGGATLNASPISTTLSTEAAVAAVRTALETSIAAKMAKVSASASGQVIIASSTGDATASGSILGGSTFATTPVATTLASELGSKTYTDSVITSALTWKTTI